MKRRYYQLLSLLIGILVSQNLLAVSACKKNGATVYTKACFDELQAKKLNRQAETETKPKREPEPRQQPELKREPEPQQKPEPTPQPALIPTPQRQIIQPATPPSRIASENSDNRNKIVGPIQSEPTATASSKKTDRKKITPDKKYSPALSESSATQPPACDFYALVDRVQSAAKDQFIACSVSALQLNQQDQRKTSSGRSLLHWAVASQQPEMVKLLLELGADIGLQSRSDLGAQAIHLAAQNGQIKILQQLLKQGAALESRDFFKRTPLHRAIEAGQFESSEQLIGAGANPNASDRIGKTPLMLSIKQPDTRLIRLLLDSGADTARKNTRGMTALHLAAIQSNQAVNVLLQQGVDIDPRNREGQTPLLLAANLNPQRYWSMIKLLIEQGASIRSSANDKQTLLDYSLTHNHLPLFELLLSRGWDSDQISLGQLKGKTAFMQVLKRQGRI